MPLMTPIRASTLTAIQAQAVAITCDLPCTIMRSTAGVEDAYGTKTPVYTLIATTVCGLQEPTAGQLQNYDYLIADRAAWTARLPIGTDLAHQDHLVIGCVPATTLYPSPTLYPWADVQTLEVHVLLTPRSYPVLLSAIVAEIK
jgi:hypothetical protein